MDSKAIAIVIIGAGIMVLIVCAAIGAPADTMVHAFSGWPAEAHTLTMPAGPAIIVIAGARPAAG